MVPDTSRKAIELSDISISFSSNQVLKKVHFSLSEGEVHALAGSNGAGKSTLMKILNGVYQHDSGTITIFDQAVHFTCPEDARKMGIGMVFQDLSLVSTLTVAENVFLHNAPYKKWFVIDDKKNNQRAQELLHMVGVKDEFSSTTPVERLSGGQKQIVEIVKALAREPKILILDEPTASLTNLEIERFFSVIETLKQRHISIIYITHYLKDILKICDTVTVLRDGINVFNSATSECDISTIIYYMLGKESKAKVWDTKRSASWHGKTPLLETHNLTTAHVHDISLQVHAGQVIGIAGLLGSGRSELMNALYGFDRIVDGELLLEGKPVTIHSPTDAIMAGIILVPEDRREKGLILDFSVADNVVMAILKQLGRYGLIDKKKHSTIVEKYISSLNIVTEGKAQKMKFLSGGNQQKSVLAKCLSANAKILLLDDPTFGVDIHAKYEIMQIIRTYVENGNGAIFISSEFNEIVDFCDSIYVLNHGKIEKYIDEKITEEELLYFVQ